MAGPIGKLICTAALGLALAGCAVAPFDTDPPAGPRPTAPFDAALFDAYVALGDAERAEYDWRDAAGFYRRADMVAAGERVEPEALDLRKLPEAAVPTLAAARKRLVDALAAGARALTPEAAARAQAGFDCWLQEQEEDLQPDDIAACRDRFETAMVEVERALKGAVVVLLADPDGEVGAVELSNDKGSVTLSALRESAVVPEDDAAPDATGRLPEQDVQEIFGTALAAQPQPPTTIRLYFQAGTNQLTPESEAALPSVRELIENRVVPGVEIAGHTDRVGAAPVNARLALQRAQVIEQMLLELGVPPRLIRVDSFGENDPVVPTADGVDEPRNRRVEITVR
ncbi:OmpA family protein [Marinibaculum pumilum]|uniref:OmpA family protein n=1 Tax=Marinibaculum pumilum TaxID=1766165 RepID=A0ABV7L7M7_9PROT